MSKEDTVQVHIWVDGKLVESQERPKTYKREWEEREGCYMKYNMWDGQAVHMGYMSRDD